MEMLDREPCCDRALVVCLVLMGREAHSGTATDRLPDALSWRRIFAMFGRDGRLISHNHNRDRAAVDR